MRRSRSGRRTILTSCFWNRARSAKPFDRTLSTNGTSFFFFLFFLKGTRGNLFVFVTLSLLLLSTTLLVYIYRETIERFAGIKFYFSTRFSTFDILIRLNNLNSLSSSSYSSWSWQNHRFFKEKYIRLKYSTIHFIPLSGDLYRY